jgi:hypothetical protein
VPDNRRSTTRHVVDLSATLTVAGAPEACRVVNLALGGAYIAERKLPMGVRVRIAFRIPGAAGSDESVDTPATVRWGDAGGIGLQFDGLRARETWALGKYLDSLP